MATNQDILFDVSEYQGVVDFTKTDRQGGWLRTCEWRPERGGRRIDEQLPASIVAAAWVAKKAVGGYERFNVPKQDPADAAGMFYATLCQFGLTESGCLLPAADIERTGLGTTDAAVDWVAWTRAFFRVWNLMTDSAPILLYSSGSFFASLLGGVESLPRNVSFWVADWTPGPGETKYTFGGRTLVHQHENKGSGAFPLQDALMPWASLADITQGGGR